MAEVQQQMLQRLEELTRQMSLQNDTITQQSQQMMQQNAHVTQLRQELTSSRAQAAINVDGPVSPNGAVPKPKNFSGEHKDYMAFP